MAYSHWAYPYLGAAKQCGIVLGREDGSFGLGEPITREDAAAMLCRACKAAALELTNRQESAVFADQTEISAYAEEAVAVLSGAGIVNGMEGNRFGPKENTTRAQAAKMVYEVKMTAEDKEAAK